MKPHEIEFRVIKAIESLRKSIPLPATAVATFSRWPKPGINTARHIAASANAARGRNLLWLIGVHSSGTGPGADLSHFKDWWASLLPFFEGLAPEITPLAIPFEPGKKLVALHIPSDRAPYIVGHHRKASFSGEVPWLDDSGVRSARRSELIALLSPLQDLPMLEILDTELTAWEVPKTTYGPKLSFRWTLDATVYVVPKADTRVVIPFHRCRAEIGLTGSLFTSKGMELSLTPDRASTAVRVTESALLIEGLGRFFLFCCGQTKEPDLPLDQSAWIRFDFHPSGMDRSATVQSECLPFSTNESNQLARWKL